MIIIDDIKSLYNQITRADLHERIAFNELGYVQRVEGRVYAFCPFCRKILELDADELEKEEPDKPIKLKHPVSCDCRIGLRYLRKGILESVPEIPSGRKKRRKNKIDPLMIIRNTIRYKANVYKKSLEREAIEAAKKSDPEPKEKTRQDGLHGSNDSYRQSSAGNSSPGIGIGAAAAAYRYSQQLAHIPDDFEPDMDPYDREALYEEEMLDDWVIASGGNPYDFDDRVDAFSDPFGFHDDFGGGDGGFDGFGDWGGFVGGDE